MQKAHALNNLRWLRRYDWDHICSAYQASEGAVHLVRDETFLLQQILVTISFKTSLSKHAIHSNHRAFLLSP